MGVPVHLDRIDLGKVLVDAQPEHSKARQANANLLEKEGAEFFHKAGWWMTPAVLHPASDPCKCQWESPFHPAKLSTGDF
jgi:hypothetical protein